MDPERKAPGEGFDIAIRVHPPERRQQLLVPVKQALTGFLRGLQEHQLTTGLRFRWGPLPWCQTCQAAPIFIRPCGRRAAAPWRFLEIDRFGSTISGDASSQMISRF